MATETIMKVHILSCTEHAERVCAAAAKQCYSPDNASEAIWQLTEQEIKKVLTHCIKSGHLAVLSGASATISVNVSRSTLTQLNTHAWIKTVTQSQQYIDHRDFRYHVPDAFKDNKDAMDAFNNHMEQSQLIYNMLRNMGFKPEDAREVLPNGAEANTVMSGNLWGWFNFLQRRVCKRNTPQTLKLSQKILELFQQSWPTIFNLCGAPCMFDKCREMSPCGKPYPPYFRQEVEAQWVGR